MKERDTQRLILDWLQAEHVLAYRMNTGAARAEYKGRSRLIRYGVPGMADIIAFPQRNRGPLWIETKAPGGKQSELQKSFQEQVERHGHQYVVAQSLDDVIAHLPDIRANRQW